MDFSLQLDHTDSQSQEAEEEFHKQFKGNMDRCNLIINYLPQDIDDNALRGMFAEFGEIIQAKVIRDKTSKKSLGYGFVKYLKEEDATLAINKMNGFPLGHKKLKVSYARLSSEEIKNCKLYITNLPRSFTTYDVTNLFSQFGEIIECRLLRDRQTGVNKGVAFVQFNVRAEADRAMSLDGQYIDGTDKPLIIKFAEDQHKKRERRPLPMVPNRFRQESPYLFPVDHLSTSGIVSPKGLGYQPVTNSQAYLPVAVAMPYGGYQIKYTNPVSGPSGGNWYGPMQTQHHLYDNVGVGVGVGMPAPIISNSRHNAGLSYEPIEMDLFGQQRPSSTLFMTNSRGAQDAGYNTNVTLVVSRLPSNFDVPMIQDLFSPYGRILGAHIDAEEYIQADGRYSVPSGRAYIQMETLSQAQNAVQALNGLNSFQREGLGPLQVDIYGRGGRMMDGNS